MSRKAKIIGDSLTIGTRQAIGLILITLQTLFAAKYLGPAGFGTFAIISVLTMMAAVGTPGFLAAASRELPHHRARNDQVAETAVLNHTVCGELAVAALWTVIIAVVALLQRESSELMVYLLLIAATVIPAKTVSLYQLVGYVEKDFDFQSRGALLITALTAGLVITLVWKLGLYIVFLAPLVTSVAGILYYRTRYSLRPRPGSLMGRELARLARIGLPMTGLTIVSGSNGLQRWGERSLLSLYLGPAALGIYAFCAWVTLAFYSVFGGLLQALQPHIYELVSGELNEHRIDQTILRPMWVIIVLALFVIGLAMVVLPGLIIAILPEYAAGITVLHLLLFATLLSCVYWIPGIMMSAVRFDAQFRYLMYWCIAVGLSLGTGMVLLTLKWGITALAVGYLLSQAVLMILTFRFFWSYIFSAPRAFRSFLRDLIWPVVNVTTAVAVVLFVGEISIPELSNAWENGIFALIKGIGFIILALPTLIMLERRTSVYTAHIRPFLHKLLAI